MRQEELKPTLDHLVATGFAVVETPFPKTFKEEISRFKNEQKIKGTFFFAVQATDKVVKEMPLYELEITYVPVRVGFKTRQGKKET